MLKHIISLLCHILYACVIYGEARAAFQSKIVNGTNAKEGDFPYAVSLRRSSDHICGGTILNEKFILTAARCVCRDNRPKDSAKFSIQYDVIEIKTEPINTVNVKKINCHNFSFETLINDAAVLELEKPIPNGNWTPIKLSKNFSTDVEQKGTIIGWGRIYPGGPLSKTLQKLDVDIYDDKTCGGKHNPTHHICFGASIGGACNADSGTALIVDGIQVGISSFMTAPCGTANKEHPNVYSRVATYYNWIAKIAGL